MNQFLAFDESQPDIRCEVCRHHKYLILSMVGEEVKVLHSCVHYLRGNDFPAITRGQGIHWWGTGYLIREAPECLKSYKIIGGK